MSASAWLILFGLVLYCASADQDKHENASPIQEATLSTSTEEEKAAKSTTTNTTEINLDEPSSKLKDKIPDKTRLIFFEYDINSTTWLYEVKSGRENGIETTIKAKYSFDILHHDNKGNILARYRLLKCISGPCNYRMPDVLVDFIQGGNNLEGIYIKLKKDEKPEWNLLLAIIHSINTPAVSGAGDEQNVVTPYGLCHCIFSRPYDKKFRRRLDQCSFDGFRNHSLMPGVTMHKYKQDIVYHQNAKVDADIVFIEAEETLFLSSDLDYRWNLHLETESHMEMMNRTMKYMKRLCPFDTTAEYCATEIFNATKIGRNWEEIMKALELGKIVNRPKLRNLLSSYTKKLTNEQWQDTDGTLPNLFTQIVDAVMLCSEEELEQIVEEFRDDSEKNQIMSLLIDALAAAGTLHSHRIARRLFTSEKPEYLKKYLQSLVLTTKLNNAVTKELQKWFDECHKENVENEICEQVAFTLASLYKRYCDSTVSSKNACNKNKEKHVKKFLDTVMTCTTMKCHEKALQILRNLPIASVVPYAAQFLCSKDNETMAAQKDALKLLSEIPTEMISGRDLKKVLCIFRGSCPLPQSTTDQTLAMEVLLNAIPHHTAVGTYLLRLESLQPENHDKWAFFYDNLALQRNANELVDEYWSQLRKFRVFRPNYAQRSLLSSSNAFRLILSERERQKLSAVSKTEFHKAAFKRSEFTLATSTGKQHLPLFGIAVDTEGLESALGSESENSETPTNTSEILEASVQLMLFGKRFPPIKLFTGYSQLMSAIWNADGEKFDAYEINLVVRQYRTAIPLLSGLIAEVRFAAAVSLDLDGSVQVSLWNRNAQASLISNVSMSLEGTIALSSASLKIGQVTSYTGLVGSVTTDFNVEFYSEPYIFCTVVGQGPLYVSHLYQRLEEGKPKKRLQRKQTRPPHCFTLNLPSTQMCNQWIQHVNG